MSYSFPFDKLDIPDALPMRRPLIGDVVAQRDPSTGEIRRATVEYFDMEDADSVTFMARPDGQPDRKAWFVWRRKDGERQDYRLVAGQLDLEQLGFFS